MHREETRSQNKIYTVSGFTSELKAFLEEKYPFVWIQGEISNLSKPSSGHLYFTLKDNKSQISAVIFKNLGHQLKFNLENGLQITGLARVNVYEPRGAYQLIFEFVDPKGAGALQLAFEQLKTRLSQEGLFDETHKKKLPFLPERISIITSPTGAVIHDIFNIINRRYPNIILEIVPVTVQGERSEFEICSALKMINERNIADLIIIARGGGSLEDLAPFNSESLARAVFSSDIPVVSAVGHETDYTICDFVADLRAPTPSAAAELVVPLKKDLISRINTLNNALKQRINGHVDQQRKRLFTVSEKLVDPKRKIIDMRLLTEDYTQRLIRNMKIAVSHKKESMTWRHDRLIQASPRHKNRDYKNRILHLKERMISSIKMGYYTKQTLLNELDGKLKVLSPAAILDRGYSITRTIPHARIVKDSAGVSTGQELEVILSQGSLRVAVKGMNDDGKEKF